MSKFLDYSPHNGSWIEGDYNLHDDTMTVKKMNDVAPLLDYCKEERNSGINDSVMGKDYFFAKYAMLPPSVQIELHQKGIQLGNPHHTHRLIKEIEQNYPNFKLTNMRHHVKE